ncbi:MAG TPA: hypothetical protein VFF73_12140 [Planctomycetota bacterium]|nr:hypothetical protein [Planctomycetota bacterium]
MEKELDLLLKRARAVLARHEGTRPGARARGVIGGASLVALAEPVFYELGVASSDKGPVATLSLRLEHPGATLRTFRIALWASSDRIVLATRWSPLEKRPLVARGEGRADAWSSSALEGVLEERLGVGEAAFERELATGGGHLESSGDLLGLPGDA